MIHVQIHRPVVFHRTYFSSDLFLAFCWIFGVHHFCGILLTRSKNLRLVAFQALQEKKTYSVLQKEIVSFQWHLSVLQDAIGVQRCVRRLKNIERVCRIITRYNRQSRQQSSNKPVPGRRFGCRYNLLSLQNITAVRHDIRLSHQNHARRHLILVRQISSSQTLDESRSAHVLGSHVQKRRLSRGQNNKVITYRNH